MESYNIWSHIIREIMLYVESCYMWNHVIC